MLQEISVHELQDTLEYRPWERETVGELIRQTMTLRSIAKLTGTEAAEMAELDYIRALARRMVQSEQMYVVTGPYYAHLYWLPIARCWYVEVEEME